MNLEEYHRKRNFEKTPEPVGENGKDSGRHRFVIQRHAARRLHYDLRLEIEGTLKSWAVPKGPSMNPADKRLAVRTEDHPISYLTFQGKIPKGNYGAGHMSIWDQGFFQLDNDNTLNLEQQLENGNLKVTFQGSKMKGRFALVRTGFKSDKEQWLLIKKQDEYALNALYDAESFSNAPKESIATNELTPGLIIKPMLASSTSKQIFNDPKWLYELKWDGYRIIAHVSNKGVLLQSRNGINYNQKFEDLHSELQGLEDEVILDGEVVILTEDGISQFGELQNYPDTQGVLRFYVFDMLYLNGHSMLGLPLSDRKSLIKEVIGDLQITKYCDHIQGMGTALYEKAIAEGMEGVMAKMANSTYTIGQRTDKWLKIKAFNSVDAIICGVTESKKMEAFGSLILGEINEQNQLIYIGNCGTGLGASTKKGLKELFASYFQEECPFENAPSLKGRKPKWMQPILNCEVTYSERTKNNLLRNPVFKRLINGELQLESKPSKSYIPSVTINKTTRNNNDFVTVDGIKVPISNLDKIYWPKSQGTKFDLIDYYLKIAPYILPHLKDRPQSLHRHPNGIDNDDFYQKDNVHIPDWLETIGIYSKSSEREINYLLCQNTASLLYMANLGCIEINPWNSRIQHLENPDYGIIDLDPPESMRFKNLKEIFFVIQTLLDEIQVKSFCKLSGSKGIHVYLPMGAKFSYEEVRNFIKLICIVVQQRIPQSTTLERLITKRNGKLYLDYLQNRRGQTVASVYSVRPLPNAPISAPFDINELNNISSSRHFTMKSFAERLTEVDDIFQPILNTSINMENSLHKLEKLL
ncbi:bifunctional non-homologous end joining protein LigD [Flavobacteriaceae bacterium MAR_2009_75]|nr:bifunctional non-homologous end joining protein LigD [Flavobacteriaceae bacterium MAR_2009_75]